MYTVADMVALYVVDELRGFGVTPQILKTSVKSIQSGLHLWKYFVVYQNGSTRGTQAIKELGYYVGVASCVVVCLSKAYEAIAKGIKGLK